MFEILKKKYLKHFIRKDQLVRYVQLGVITEAQMQEILALE